MENEKLAMENSRKLAQKQLEEMRLRREQEINEKRADLNRSLELSEQKKKEEEKRKEIERREIDLAKERQMTASKLYSAERLAAREKLAKELAQQIQEKLYEQKSIAQKERDEYLKNVPKKCCDPTTCPHGKKYVCAHCCRSYPRAYLEKRPLKYY